jgi:predicted RNA-binding protein with PUA-like domain
MNYYLAKTDPDTYSIDDFAKEGTTTWNGVTNPTAVQFLKKMEKGDRVLIYHSQGQTTIVGLAEVAGNSRPDPNNPKSWLVDFTYIKTFPEPRITLKQVKDTGKFSDFKLVRLSRLSTMDVPEDFIMWLKEQGLDV